LAFIVDTIITPILAADRDLEKTRPKIQLKKMSRWRDGSQDFCSLVEVNWRCLVVLSPWGEI
jgi:hypothetical protein